MSRPCMSRPRMSSPRISSPRMSSPLPYWLALIISFYMSVFCGPTIQAQTTYPQRPVRVLNPSSPGGGADVIGRLIQQELTKSLGQTFIVENRPGAANIIATEIASKAAPDGYTLLLGTTGTFVTNPLLYEKLSYSNKQFEPISLVADAPFILSVHPSLPVNNLAELIAYAKENPNKLSVASFGNGSSSHLAGELFQMLTGTKLIHVPYKGSAPGMADLLAGNISMTFDSGLSSIPNIQAKKIRPIAVASTTRLANLPDVPTFGEAGLNNFYVGSWYGFFAPAGTPAEIMKKLNQQIVQASKLPEVTQRINNLGAIVVANSAEDFTKQIARESETWSVVVKKLGIKLD